MEIRLIACRANRLTARPWAVREERAPGRMKQGSLHNGNGRASCPPIALMMGSAARSPSPRHGDGDSDNGCETASSTLFEEPLVHVGPMLLLEVGEEAAVDQGDAERLPLEPGEPARIIQFVG